MLNSIFMLVKDISDSEKLVERVDNNLSANMLGELMTYFLIEKTLPFWIAMPGRCHLSYMFQTLIACSDSLGFVDLSRAARGLYSVD